MKRTPAERFLRHVQKSDGCWLWMASVSKRTGYGSVTIDGKTVGAHRVSYGLFVGDVPDGMYVCHRCDNPRCVRPDHLFIGTPKDNVQDMIRKGRSVPPQPGHAIGIANGNAKLTDEDVLSIRARYPAEGLSLAKEFRVHRQTIYTIAHGRRRASVRP